VTYDRDTPMFFPGLFSGCGTIAVAGDPTRLRYGRGG
jgi:hypothetical protein